MNEPVSNSQSWGTLPLGPYVGSGSQGSLPNSRPARPIWHPVAHNRWSPPNIVGWRTARPRGGQVGRSGRRASRHGSLGRHAVGRVPRRSAALRRVGRAPPPTAAEEQTFDAFDSSTWNFKPAPTPWYRTGSTPVLVAAVSVAAVALVVSVVLLAFRGTSGIRPRPPTRRRMRPRRRRPRRPPATRLCHHHRRHPRRRLPHRRRRFSGRR